MKKYANVDSDGIGTPISPIQMKFSLPDVADCCWNREEGIEHYKWMEQHPPLKVYTKKNELVRNCRVEIEGPIYQYKGVLDEDNWASENANAYKVSFEEYTRRSKLMCSTVETRQIYLEVEAEKEQVKEEKPLTDAQQFAAVDEKELYYCLSDNADLNGLYLSSMREVSEHIEMDLGDINPSDREKVQYTITPVYLTQTEFDSLPEYEG